MVIRSEKGIAINVMFYVMVLAIALVASVFILFAIGDIAGNVSVDVGTSLTYQHFAEESEISMGDISVLDSEGVEKDEMTKSYQKSLPFSVSFSLMANEGFDPEKYGSEIDITIQGYQNQKDFTHCTFKIPLRKGENPTVSSRSCLSGLSVNPDWSGPVYLKISASAKGEVFDTKYASFDTVIKLSDFGTAEDAMCYILNNFESLPIQRLDIINDLGQISVGKADVLLLVPGQTDGKVLTFNTVQCNKGLVQCKYVNVNYIPCYNTQTYPDIKLTERLTIQDRKRFSVYTAVLYRDDLNFPLYGPTIDLE